MSRSKREISGCVDLGSSYFRLIVAERSETAGGLSIEPVFEDLRYVGWGRDVENEGAVSRESMDRAEESLVELVALSSKAGCPEPFLAGTNTLRKARNSEEIISRLEKRVSLAVHVFSELGEAAAGLEGASSILGAAEKAVVIDLGGTSTEVSWGEGGVFSGYIEVGFGTHSVAASEARRDAPYSYRLIRRNFFDRLGRTGAPSAARLFEALSSLPQEYENSNIIATGGTAVSLAVILGFLHRKSFGIDDMVIDRDQLDLIIRRSERAIKAGFVKSLPVPAERAALLLPGMVILESFIESIGARSIRITARDMRWGILLSGGSIPGRYIVNG